MKKTGLLIALIIFTSTYANTQTFAQGMGANFTLFQNSPNPFEETTNINFNLQEDCYVKLNVVNLETGEIILLVDGEVSAGKHGMVFKSKPESKAKLYQCRISAVSMSDKTRGYYSMIEMKQK